MPMSMCACRCSASHDVLFCQSSYMGQQRCWGWMGKQCHVRAHVGLVGLVCDGCLVQGMGRKAPYSPPRRCQPLLQRLHNTLHLLLVPLQGAASNTNQKKGWRPLHRELLATVVSNR